MQSKFFLAFQNILKEKSEPVLNRFSADGETILSASNIYTLVLNKIKLLNRQGLKANMIFMSIPDDMNCIVDLLACSFLNATYFPVNAQTQKKILGQEFFNTTYSQIDDKSFILHSAPSWHRNETLYPVMIATSGSEAQKLVSYHEDGLLFQLREHAKIFHKYKFEHKLSVLPKYHCFGLVLDLLLGLWMRQYVTFLPSNFTKKELRRVLDNYKIDVITCVPRQVEALVQCAKVDHQIMLSLRTTHLFCGGAPLKVVSSKKFQSFFGGIIEGYGLTEAGPGVMINNIAIQGVELKIVNGLLEIKSPSNAHFIDSSNSLEENVVQTEDLFEKKSDRFHFRGRSGNKIKNSAGVFELKNEVENRISSRTGSTIFLIKSENKIKIFELYNKKNMSNSLRDWIYEKYPCVDEVHSIHIRKAQDLFFNNNGKSNDDVLKKILQKQESSLWVN